MCKINSTIYVHGKNWMEAQIYPRNTCRYSYALYRIILLLASQSFPSLYIYNIFFFSFLQQIFHWTKKKVYFVALVNHQHRYKQNLSSSLKNYFLTIKKTFSPNHPQLITTNNNIKRKNFARAFYPKLQDKLNTRQLTYYKMLFKWWAVVYVWVKRKVRN